MRAAALTADGSVEGLRGRLGASGGILSEPLAREIASRSGPLQAGLGRSQQEWLPLVDRQGRPLPAAWAGRNSLLQAKGGGLAAPRWLAHGLGLRHPVVHLVLETHEGSGIWLQRRAVTRPESPGRLDISVGGHMAPGDTPESALVRETHEELGLDLEGDCAEIRRSSVYESISRTKPPGSIDAEWRHVFVARAKPGVAWRFHLDPGELAGVAPWPFGRIMALLQNAPQRCASGLAESVRLYLEARRKKS